MNEDLLKDWNIKLNQNLDVNTQWGIIKEEINLASEKHIPSYLTTEDKLWKKGKIPLKSETRKEIRKKHRLWQRAYETKQEQKVEKWKQQRNKVNKLLKEAEAKLELDIANQCKINPKKTMEICQIQN